MSHSYDRLHQICPIHAEYLCRNPSLDWNFIEIHPGGYQITIPNSSDYYNYYHNNGCNDVRGGYLLAKKYLIDYANSRGFFPCEVEYYEYNTKTGGSTQVSKTDFYQGTRYGIELNEMINTHVNDNLIFYLNNLFKTQTFKEYAFKRISNNALNFDEFVHELDYQTLEQLGIEMLNQIPGVLDELIVKDEIWIKNFKNLNNRFIDGAFIVVKWSTIYLSENPSLSWSFVCKYPDGFDSKGWHIRMICSTMKLDSNFYNYVKLHPEGFNNENWPLFSLLRNKTLNWDFIDENFNIFKNCLYTPGWECDMLLNPSLRWNFVCKYPDGINGLKWNMKILCCNPNLGDEFWTYVSEKPEGLFGEFTVYPWDINALSANKSLSWNFVINNHSGLNDKPWNVEILCKNDGLGRDFFEYIAKHDTFFGTKWNYNTLFENTSEYLIPILLCKFQKMNLSQSNVISLLRNTGAKKYVKDILAFDCFKIKYFTASILTNLQYLLSSNEYLLWEDFIESINDVTFKNPIMMFDTDGLLQNESLTKDSRFWKFFLENPTGFYRNKMQCNEFKCKWSLSTIQRCHNLDWTLLDEFPNGFNSQRWNVFVLASNQGFNANIIKHHHNGINGEKWPCTIWELPLINDF